MSEVTLLAESGRTTGSPESRRLRAEDRIPAVVYGNGVGPISVTVGRRDVRLALTGAAGVNAIVNLSVDGKVHPTVVKEIQRHKVRRTVNHIDFLVVNLNEEITVDVPVHLTGEAKAVLSEGGMVDPTLDTLPVISTPRNIPNEISIDVSEMGLDSVIRLADIKLPANTRCDLDPDTVLVTVMISRAAVEAAAAADAPAEGDKPAAS
jgi:large subunit ribosomal protein L25